MVVNAGITRIVITDQISGRGAWRFEESRRRWPAAHQLYREIFDRLGTPLLPGANKIECSKEEFEAGYDYALGIDVILAFQSGMQMTLQEKFLYTNFRTVTVEYQQNPDANEPGDWFTMRAQLYFVGYDRIQALSFQDWILLDWPQTQMATARGQIPWKERRNQNDGARASFRYAEFDRFPKNCVLASSLHFDPHGLTTRQARRHVA